MALEAKAYTSTPAKSSGVDTAGFEGCLFLVTVGLWTSGTWDFKLQECDTDTDGGYTDVAAGDQLQNFAEVMSTATDQKTLCASYLGGKRWVRVVGTGASTPSAVFGVVSVLHNARHHAHHPKE